MKSAKEFVRIAYGSWVLAVSLALGWAGAAAAEITLSVDKPKIREEAGKTEITVTAKMDADATANTAVALVLGTSAAPVLGPGNTLDTHGRFTPGTGSYWYYAADRPGGDWKNWYNTRSHINSRFAITLPTIVIPKGKKEATGTVVLTPTNNDDRGFYNTYDDFTIPHDLDDDYPKRYPDLVIEIDGLAGGQTVTPVEIQVVDDEKLSSQLDLSFSPASLSKDAGPTQVTVTATLNGGTLRSDQTFNLVFTNASGLDAADYPQGITFSNILTRDTDYSATAASLTLRRNKTSAKATITIDPKGKAGRIVLKSSRRAVLKGVDLNLDGDRRDTLDAQISGIFVSAPRRVQFNELSLGCRSSTTGSPLSQHDVNFDGSCYGVLREARLGVDLNGDGEIRQPANNGVISTDQADFYLWANEEDAAAAAAEIDFVHDKDPGATIIPGVPTVGNEPEPDRFGLIESLLPQYVTIPPHFFEIKFAPIVDLKDPEGGLSATPATIREGAGRSNISLTVTLNTALEDDARVTFTIEPEEGRRDIDYTISLSDLTIPAGATSATATLTVTPVDNSTVNASRSFIVVATVGDGFTEARETITIVDDETQSSEITLVVAPRELTAGAGTQEVTVIATLDGEVFDEDVPIILVVTTDTDADGDMDADDKAATRDTEYTATLRPLTIPAGKVSGSTVVSITPLEGGDKRIGLTALKSPVKNDEDEDVTVSTAVITLKDGDPAAPTTPDALRFVDDIDVVSTVFEYTVGTAIEPFILPAATGGVGNKMYSVSASLPAGLSFDAITRTLSGTPTMADTATVIYTVIDSAPDPVNTDALSLTFEIGSAPPPTVKVASVISTHSSVRENGETTAILLTASLAAPSAKAETVLFTIVAPSAGTPAARDADYTASLGGSVVIAAGETEGRTLLTLTPLDNEEVDGNRFLGVQAEASGGAAQTDIKIADDETPATAFALSVEPHTISEDAGVTDVTVTATLDGKGLDEETTVTVMVDQASVATRDLDYSVLYEPSLVIPAGALSGSLIMLLDPTPDSADEGSETITLNGSSASLTGGSVHITLLDAGNTTTTPEEPEEPEETTPLAFAAGTSVDAQEFTAGAAIDAMALPAAAGGMGDVTYSVSDLPAGLSFNPATRTLSGIPNTATDGAVEVTYTATDGAGNTASLTLSIEVSAMLMFDNFFDFFAQFLGAGKVVPTASGDGAALREFVVGEPVAIVLPPAQGGTAPLTYSLSPALPAGLAFDAATRTISGTPQAEGSPVYTYTVTDATGAQVEMLLQTRPAAFTLTSNYPNPFNPATTIQYALPQAADVELTVYNVVGQVVRTLVAEHQSAGRYLVTWDATDDSGHSLSSGLYFYRLQAGDEFHAVKKMLLFK